LVIRHSQAPPAGALSRGGRSAAGDQGTARRRRVGRTGMAPSELYERHRATLESAVEAIRGRHYWSPYPESPSPKVYGEGAAAAGEAAFQAYLGKDFPLDQV